MNAVITGCNGFLARHLINEIKSKKPNWMLNNNIGSINFTIICYILLNYPYQPICCTNNFIDKINEFLIQYKDLLALKIRKKY